MNPVDDFLDGITLDDANGWHRPTPEPRQTRRRRYRRNPTGRPEPRDSAWDYDDGSDVPPRWADV